MERCHHASSADCSVREVETLCVCNGPNQIINGACVYNSFCTGEWPVAADFGLESTAVSYFQVSVSYHERLCTMNYSPSEFIICSHILISLAATI